MFHSVPYLVSLATKKNIQVVEKMYMLSLFPPLLPPDYVQKTHASNLNRIFEVHLLHSKKEDGEALAWEYVWGGESDTPAKLHIYVTFVLLLEPV